MIVFEDGSATADRAVQLLWRERRALKLPKMRISRLPDFLEDAKQSRLTPREREIICDQAILVIEQFYAHLPFKRARYAIDPVQRIRLLRAGLRRVPSDLAFHSELIQAFADLRDVHTSYRLPPPYSGAIAFLPFFLQSYFAPGNERRFLVTHVLPGFEHTAFEPGVEVTQWNGMPVERAVQVLAEHIPGGNPAARFMRGLMRMTVRSLSTTLAPDEEVVYVRYRPLQRNAGENILQVPWYVGTGLGTDVFEESGRSVCEPLKDLSIVREVLWCREEWKHDRQAAWSPRKAAPLVSRLPAVFQVQHPGGSFNPQLENIDPGLLLLKGKRFGYIRIKTFEGEADEIFAEFKRLLGLMRDHAPDGLIIDVRGNAGGDIAAAERLLQLLTPVSISPAPFHFANTPAVQAVFARLQDLSANRLQHLSLLAQINAAKPYFEDWFSDTLETAASGSLLTSGRPLTSPEDANDTGQVYHGPAVLIVDAASYSATDIFAAGFQDHAMGEIIGVDDNTGGGGASRWKHSQELVERLKGLVDVQPPLKVLPAGTSLALALQRSSRVGPNAGEPLEDLGVQCSIRYRLTKADLIGRSARLIQFACRVLAKKPTYRLDVELKKKTRRSIHVTAQCRNIAYLVCMVNGSPELKVAARANQSFRVPLPGKGTPAAHELRIHGYAVKAQPGARRKALALVAASTIRL